MFSRLWKFLSEDNNRKVLGFLGAGIVALIGGVWTAYVYFADSAPSPKPQVVAQDSGVAAGGNITVGGNLVTGLTEKKLLAILKLRDEEIRKERSAHPKDLEKQALLEKELAALEQKSIHLEETLKATQKIYSDTIHLFNQKLSAQLPKNRIEQAKTAIADGDPALAETLLEEVAASRLQQSAEASYQLGLLAKDRVDFAAAWKALARAAELAPDNPLYLREAGLMAHTVGRYDTAIEYFDKAVAIHLKAQGTNHPEVTKLWNHLGKTWREKGEYDKAIEYLEKADSG